MSNNYYCDEAYALYQARKEFESKILKRTAILLTHWHAHERPTRKEFEAFCAEHLNMSRSNGYRLMQALREGAL